MGVPPSPGPIVGDSRKAGGWEWVQLGFLLSIPLPACWAIWSLPPPPHGGTSPSHHPKDHDTPKLPWPDSGCRLQDDRSCGPGRILGGDPKGLGVTLGRRGCLPLLSVGRQVAAPDPQTHSPT